MTRRRFWRAALCLSRILLFFVVSVTGCGGEAEKDMKKHAKYVAIGINDGATPRVPGQSHCPVCGNPIVPHFHNGSDDARVYFCCQGCADSYKGDPSKYEANLTKEEAENFVGTDPYEDEGEE